MDQNDREAIDALFAKLSEVEGRTGPRDEEAEALIRRRISEQPGAPYYMAQTIVVQEQALMAAQQRIEQLEYEMQHRSGGLLGGLFGGSPRAPAPRRAAGGSRTVPNAAYVPSGGGFLSGAAQTALGVAGGVLIANMIAGAFAGGEAQAAEAPFDEGGDFETGGDFGGGDFGGGDFGDF